MKQHKMGVFFITVILCVLGAPVLADDLTWTTIYKGIDHTHVSESAPLVNALRIDLNDSTLEFYSTPSNEGGDDETDAQKASDFLMSSDVQVAINANFFGPSGWWNLSTRDLLGLAVSQGQVVSSGEAGYEELLISSANDAWFQVSPPTTDMSNVNTAVSGSDMILLNGVNVGRVTSSHPRTAVGVSQDGRYLYMLTVDGRQEYGGVRYAGATLFETATWLVDCGAYNGLALDGGGSTTMVKSDGRGGAKLLNVPVGDLSGTLGSERLNGNHLGVFAQPAFDQDIWSLLQIASLGNGSVSHSNGLYNAGTNLMIVAIPAVRYRFEAWGGDVPAGHGNDNPFIVSMDQNRYLTASFVEHFGPNTTNTLTYVETFELYTNGITLPGMNGWSAAGSMNAVVSTNVILISSLAAYSEPCGYPASSANHTKVLEVSGSVTNHFEMSDNQIVWVDHMVLPVHGALPTDTNILADVQAAVGFNTNSHPSVWYYDLTAASNRWAVIEEDAVPDDEWARLTFLLDYQTDDPVNGVRYFQVHLNGVPLTHARAWSANDGSGSAGGSWFAMSSEPDRLSQFTLRAENATIALDDLVVITNNPLVTSKGIPFEWMASHGLTNGTFAEEEFVDGDGDGVVAWKEWIGDTDPANRDSVLLITNMVTSSAGTRVYWKGGVQAMQWLERSSNLVTGSWVPIFTNTPPTSVSTNFSDSRDPGGKRFYKVKAQR